MLSDYLKHLQQKGKSPHTIVSYMNDLHKFLDGLSIQPQDYIAEMDVRKWISQMIRPKEGQSLANTTINRRLNSLRSFYNWAQRNKKVKNNPMHDIEDFEICR